MEDTYRGRFGELGAPDKYRNGDIYICTHLPKSTLRFFFVMLASAQWCPVVESNVSTFFSCTCYNGILSFTFTFIHLADIFLISCCGP